MLRQIKFWVSAQLEYQHFTAAINNRSATIATGAATTIGITTTSISLGQEDSW